MRFARMLRNLPRWRSWNLHHTALTQTRIARLRGNSSHSLVSSNASSSSTSSASVQRKRVPRT